MTLYFSITHFSQKNKKAADILLRFFFTHFQIFYFYFWILFGLLYMHFDIMSNLINPLNTKFRNYHLSPTLLLFFLVEIFLLHYYSEELSSFHITLALIMQNLCNIFFRFCHFWSHRNVTITNPPATTTFILHFRSYSIPFLFKNVQ
jgi:hypothetical protein